MWGSNVSGATNIEFERGGPHFMCLSQQRFHTSGSWQSVLQRLQSVHCPSDGARACYCKAFEGVYFLIGLPKKRPRNLVHR